MRHPPLRAQTTQILEWDGGECRRRLDDIAGEEPLEIRLNGSPVAVTMRTAGDDFELAVGFLVTEGVVNPGDSITTVAYGLGPDGEPSGNVVDVTVTERAGGEGSRGAPLRNFIATSSCGICGKASIDAVRARHIVPPDELMRVNSEVLCRLPDVLRESQTVFGRTGGLHAAGLFDERGALITSREDIGRHNAVDKIVGRAWLDGLLPLSRHILLVSGRGGFEIVQKALVGGIPFVASVSAPSSLAVKLAREYDLTLIGFLRGARFVVYSGEKRMEV